MRTRWLGILILVALVSTTSLNSSMAALSEGGFRTSQGPKSAVNSQLKLYRIENGDTLWKISRSYDVDLQTLMVLNHLNKNSTLSVGQLVQIPGTRSGIYVIRAGDTMWGIAAQYNIRTSDLVRLNANVNPNDLKVGDQLVLPDNLHRMPIKEPSRSFNMSPMFFSWPITGIITSAFGWRKSGFHHGLDIAADTGTPIRACAAGKVVFTGWKSVYGRTVVIEHYNGEQTLYAHTSKIYVTNGQKVVKGQKIAAVGATGNATGPHLHLEIKKAGQALNPIKYLPQ
ncbi:MAG: M23 family metallopeptidase [Syntrophomonas sp.]